MTLCTVTLSVLIFSFFYLIYINAMHISHELGDDLRLVIYLDEEPSAPLQEEYRRKILKFDQVEKIVFINRDEAYNRFSDQLGEDKDILVDIPKTFLPPSIEVYPIKTLDSLSRIKRFSDYLQTLPGVLKVQYGKEWIERFYSFVQIIRIVVILSGFLLIMTTTFMVAHTIRLTLLARKKELELLRLVGATNNYIRTPFLLEGALQGLFGASLGVGALFLLYTWIELQFTGATLLRLFPFTFLSPKSIVLVIGAATLLCSLGSFTSTRKMIHL
ncbi:cell division protein FtsX [Desulfogranum japonicum]|uniref:cell division protein FtsX n=1 Tax=Desulfogranum japonicum TaxID=231447 RepID=UPI000426E0AC|nr:permease-like cell division protein FtsX [Desulfogranum japonicum]